MQWSVYLWNSFKNIFSMHQNSTYLNSFPVQDWPRSWQMCVSFRPSRNWRLAPHPQKTDDILVDRAGLAPGPLIHHCWRREGFTRGVGGALRTLPTRSVYSIIRLPDHLQFGRPILQSIEIWHHVQTPTWRFLPVELQMRLKSSLTVFSSRALCMGTILKQIYIKY